jgi:hypothetical protein
MVIICLNVGNPLEIFSRWKIFQRRNIFNLEKLPTGQNRNTFFDIGKCIPDPRYTRLKFLANMSYSCHHRSTAVILLFKYILA